MAQRKSNPYSYLIRAAWQHAGAQRGRLTAVYALFVVSETLGALQPAIYGWFIDRLQRDADGMLRNAWLYAGALIAIHVFSWAIHGPTRIMEQSVGFDVSLNFLRQRYHQALHLPLRWHQDHHSGATINRMRKAYESLGTFLCNGFQYLMVPFNMAFALLAMLWFSPLFGGIGLAMALLLIWSVLRFDRPLIPLQEEYNERLHDLSANKFDALSNIVSVITLRLENSMERGLLSAAQRIFPPFRRWAVLNEIKWSVTDTIIVLTQAVIVIGYVYENWQPGQMFAVGGLVALIAYVTRFTQNFQQITWQYAELSRFQTDVAGAELFEEAWREQHRPDNPPDLPQGWKVVSLSGLNYAHRAGEGARLRDLAINIERGKRIALVGESGSGKSTLLALLRGLYPADGGYTVSVDGNLCDIGSLNETAALIPQEPEIFENTIEYNVTLGLPFPESEVRRVCELAHFAHVADRLPNGLASNIKEKGVNLSGGQKQRLALARGILAAEQCDVVLLDEPTSSVDPKAELEIFEKVFRDLEGKAVVASLHRLHLLTMFDTILVLKDGAVAGAGTLEYLLETCAEFQSLWEHRDEAD